MTLQLRPYCMTEGSERDEYIKQAEEVKNDLLIAREDLASYHRVFQHLIAKSDAATARAKRLSGLLKDALHLIDISRDIHVYDGCRCSSASDCPACMLRERIKAALEAAKS